jgi:catechol 2,3-dioxygenase-like lactoylglutathione lyase family enzyme
MFHATAMVRDYDAAVARLGRLIGLRVLEYSEATDPAIGRRGGMTWIGDGSLELCEPIVDGAHPDRFVKRTGGGMQGVAVWVDDFAATVSHLELHDVEMPVQLPSGFGFSSPRATCGIQFEWAEFTVEEDPRAGAPEPAFLEPPVLDVTNLAFVGAVVEDPIADARRLAEVLDSKVVFEDRQAAAGEPVAGVSVGDCTLALYRLDREHSVELWGRVHDRPRVSLLAVRVPDLDVARAALAAADAGVIRETTGTLVLDPDTTGDVEIAVVDRLLRGDPRG